MAKSPLLMGKDVKGHSRSEFADAVEQFLHEQIGPAELKRACSLVWNCTDVAPVEMWNHVHQIVHEIYRPKRRTFASCARAIRASLGNA